MQIRGHLFLVRKFRLVYLEADKVANITKSSNKNSFFKAVGKIILSCYFEIVCSSLQCFKEQKNEHINWVVAKQYFKLSEQTWQKPTTEEEEQIWQQETVSKTNKCKQNHRRVSDRKTVSNRNCSNQAVRQMMDVFTLFLAVCHYKYRMLLSHSAHWWRTLSLSSVTCQSCPQRGLDKPRHDLVKDKDVERERRRRRTGGAEQGWNICKASKRMEGSWCDGIRE